MTIVTPTNLGTSPHPVKDVLFLVNSRIYALHGSIQFRWTVSTLYMSAFSLAYFRVSVLTYARYSNYSLILGSIFVKSVIYDFFVFTNLLALFWWCYLSTLLRVCQHVFTCFFTRYYDLWNIYKRCDYTLLRVIQFY